MGNLEQALKELPFTDLEGEYEEIKRLNKIIVELKELQEDLMNENIGGLNNGNNRRFMSLYGNRRRDNQ